MNNISIAKAVANYYGQTDFYLNHMSLDGQDFLRLLISKIGEARFAPVSLKSSVEGMLICVHALLNNLKMPSEECMSLVLLFESSYSEICNTANNELLKTFSVSRTENKFKIWQISEKIAHSYLTIAADNKEIFGSYLLLLLTDLKVSKSIPNIIQKLINSGSEILSYQESRAIAKLLLKAKLQLSKHADNESYENSLDFNQLLTFIHRQKIYFADTKTRQGALDYKTLPIDSFLSMAANLRVKCEEGNPQALKVVLACFTGIPYKYLEQVPFLNSCYEEWKLIIDLENCLVKFDLDIISPDAAVGHGEEYLSSNKVLVKPLPVFVQHSLNVHFLNTIGPVKRIGDLLNDENEPELYPYEIIAKFINSFSRVAVQHSKVDTFDAGLIACDFRGFPSSKTYYRQTTRQQIWESSEKVFQSIDWGNAVPIVDGLAFGSQAVLTDEAVSKLFSRLINIITKNRPSNNCSIKRLLAFHQVFTVYSASLAVFCLVLRETNLVKIYADEVLSGQKYVLVNDKNVHGFASMQPVSINQILNEQFSLYAIHCAAMLHRFEKMDGVNLKFIAALRAIVSGKHVPLFVTEEYPQGVPTSILSHYWGENIVENFGRHYWETIFTKLGVNSRFSSAHLRHQTSSNLNWSATSDLVLDVLIEYLSKVQECKLIELNITAVYGLSRRKAG